MSTFKFKFCRNFRFFKVNFLVFTVKNVHELGKMLDEPRMASQASVLLLCRASSCRETSFNWPLTPVRSVAELVKRIQSISERPCFNDTLFRGLPRNNSQKLNLDRIKTLWSNERIPIPENTTCRQETRHDAPQFSIYLMRSLVSTNRRARKKKEKKEENNPKATLKAQVNYDGSIKPAINWNALKWL